MNEYGKRQFILMEKLLDEYQEKQDRINELASGLSSLVQYLEFDDPLWKNNFISQINVLDDLIHFTLEENFQFSQEQIKDINDAVKSKLESITKALAGTKYPIRRDLPDGRIRFSRNVKKSKTEGTTIGSAYIFEWDPNRGTTRGWQECYNKNGEVNRVHPKVINTIKVDYPHYPPTAKDLLWK